MLMSVLLFAQIAGDAGERAAGADGADEAVDAAGALLPDLRAGGDVVGLAVVEVVPLVGEDDAVLFGGLELFGEPAADMLVIVRIGVRLGRHLDQLGAAQPQHVLLFLALRFRDHDQRAIAARVGDQREPDAGIAGGRLHHQAAGLELAALFRLQDHLTAGAVLHRAARIHELGLAQNGTAGRRRGSFQLDQGGVADGFNNAVANLHAQSRFARPIARVSCIADVSWGSATLVEPSAGHKTAWQAVTGARPRGQSRRPGR